LIFAQSPHTGRPSHTPTVLPRSGVVEALWRAGGSRSSSQRPEKRAAPSALGLNRRDLDECEGRPTHSPTVGSLPPMTVDKHADPISLSVTRLGR
jgi:hypothetical protein